MPWELEGILKDLVKAHPWHQHLVHAKAFLHIQKGNGTGGQAIRKCHTGQQGQVKLLGETTDLQTANRLSVPVPCGLVGEVMLTHYQSMQLFFYKHDCVAKHSKQNWRLSLCKNLPRSTSVFSSSDSPTISDYSLLLAWKNHKLSNRKWDPRWIKMMSWNFQNELNRMIMRCTCFWKVCIACRMCRAG